MRSPPDLRAMGQTKVERSVFAHSVATSTAGKWSGDYPPLHDRAGKVERIAIIDSTACVSVNGEARQRAIAYSAAIRARGERSCVSRLRGALAAASRRRKRRRHILLARFWVELRGASLAAKGPSSWLCPRNSER